MRIEQLEMDLQESEVRNRSSAQLLEEANATADDYRSENNTLQFQISNFFEEKKL